MEDILFFVDECKQEGGEIQTVVPIPRRIYEMMQPEFCRLLGQLGPDSKAFKGRKIKRGNVKVYSDFLHIIVNWAIASSFCKLNTVVTLDGIGWKDSTHYATAKKNISLALEHVGIRDAEKSVRSLSKQLLWFRRHFDSVAPYPMESEITLILDDAFGISRMMDSKYTLLRYDNQPAFERSLEQVLTAAANSLFEQWDTPVRIPMIRSVEFCKSEEWFGVQAADVLSHLYFSFARTELGGTDPNITLKADLFRQFFASLNGVSEYVKDNVSLFKTNDQRIVLSINDKDFSQQLIVGRHPRDGI